MRCIVAAALIFIALALGGCYSQSQNATDAAKDCRDHGGVAELDYSSWAESGSWVCKDGRAGGG